MSEQRRRDGVMKIVLVAAIGDNLVIGREGQLPWRLKSDLQHFRKLTMNRPLIMGRKTHESIGKLLPGRTNIVLSRDGSFEAKGALVCEDFSEAVQIAREQAEEDGQGEVCVIGGASLFDLALKSEDAFYFVHLPEALEKPAIAAFRQWIFGEMARFRQTSGWPG